jgi:signal transduction histidine kinase
VFDRVYPWTAVTARGETITYHAMAHRLPDGQMLVIGQDVEETDEFPAMIVHALVVGGSLMLAVGLAGAIILGRSSARHIDQMRRAIERIIAGQLSERLPVDRGGGDLARLAMVVNRMLDELERMVDEVKGVCDNIAHDMRTPLGRLLAGLERAQRRDLGETALREALDAAIEEIKDILRIFAALLRISELEDGVRRSGFEAIDIARVAADAVEYHLPVADARGVRLDLDAPRRVAIHGDPGLLFEAIGNLIDNALKFSKPDGRIAVSVGAGPSIRIADSGPGIPAAERKAVMRRFQRGETSRHLPGNGLGLPLVSAIARLHGLSTEIEDGNPGCVVVLSPATARTA